MVQFGHFSCKNGSKGFQPQISDILPVIYVLDCIPFDDANAKQEMDGWDFIYFMG